MGLSASYSYGMAKFGVNNLQQYTKAQAKYNELIKAAKEKYGKNYSQDIEQVCKILAKDPNAKIEDVEAMINNLEMRHNGITKKGKAEFFMDFHKALKALPNYNNMELSADDLIALSDIYNFCICFSEVGCNKSPLERFKDEAYQYLYSDSISALKDNKDSLQNSMNDLKDEYQKNLNVNILTGAEQLSKLQREMLLKRKI